MVTHNTFPDIFTTPLSLTDSNVIALASTAALISLAVAGCDYLCDEFFRRAATRRAATSAPIAPTTPTIPRRVPGKFNRYQLGLCD